VVFVWGVVCVWVLDGGFHVVFFFFFYFGGGGGGGGGRQKMYTYMSALLESK